MSFYKKKKYKKIKKKDGGKDRWCTRAIITVQHSWSNKICALRNLNNFVGGRTNSSRISPEEHGAGFHHWPINGGRITFPHRDIVYESWHATFIFGSKPRNLAGYNIDKQTQARRGNQYRIIHNKYIYIRSCNGAPSTVKPWHRLHAPATINVRRESNNNNN